MKHLDATDRRTLHRQLESMKRQVLDELRASAPTAELLSADGGREVDDGSCAARLQAFGTAVRDAEASHDVVRPVTLSPQSS